MALSPEARTKADEVGRALGTPDADYADSWCAAYRLACGSTLHISQGQHDRLEISTSVPLDLRSFRPYYRDREAPKTKITVRLQKPAAQIVADVRRRLLPEQERLTNRPAAMFAISF